MCEATSKQARNQNGALRCRRHGQPLLRAVRPADCEVPLPERIDGHLYHVPSDGQTDTFIRTRVKNGRRRESNTYGTGAWMDPLRCRMWDVDRWERGCALVPKSPHLVGYGRPRKVHVPIRLQRERRRPSAFCLRGNGAKRKKDRTRLALIVLHIPPAGTHRKARNRTCGRRFLRRLESSSPPSYPTLDFPCGCSATAAAAPLPEVEASLSACCCCCCCCLRFALAAPWLCAPPSPRASTHRPYGRLPTIASGLCRKVVPHESPWSTSGGSAIAPHPSLAIPSPPPPPRALPLGPAAASWSSSPASAALRCLLADEPCSGSERCVGKSESTTQRCEGWVASVVPGGDRQKQWQRAPVQNRVSREH